MAFGNDSGEVLNPTGMTETPLDLELEGGDPSLADIALKIFKKMQDAAAKIAATLNEAGAEVDSDLAFGGAFAEPDFNPQTMIMANRAASETSTPASPEIKSETQPPALNLSEMDKITADPLAFADLGQEDPLISNFLRYLRSQHESNETIN